MKTKLYKLAQRLMVVSEYDEMKEVLEDYQNFLTNDMNYKVPKIKCKSVKNYLKFFTPWFLLILMVVSFYTIISSYGLKYYTKIYTLSFIGIICIQVTFLLSNKKVMLLSKYKIDKKYDRVLYIVTIFLPILITFLSFNFENNDYIKISYLILSVALIIVSLYNYMQNSHLYFIPYYLNSIVLIFVLQISVLRSIYAYANFIQFFKYVIILNIVSLLLLLLEYVYMQKKFRRGNI